MALLEIAHGQPQQVREDVGDPLQVERRAEVEDDPRAQHGDPDLDEGEQQEAEAEHGEEVAVRGDHGAIHRPLHVEGRHDGDCLQRERQDEDLRQRALEPHHGAEQVAQPHAAPIVRGLEIRGGRDLQRDAGEMLRDLGVAEAPHAERGIVDLDAARIHRFQHHEMVEVPMQDAGRVELAELLHLEAQRTGRQVQATRGLDEVRERGAFQRDREAPAQRGEIDAMAVEARDHAERGEPALGGFRLQEDGQAPARAEAQAREQVHYALPARPSSGSKIHSMRRRRSRRMSASTCNPACSGSPRP